MMSSDSSLLFWATLRLYSPSRTLTVTVL